MSHFAKTLLVLSLVLGAPAVSHAQTATSSVVATASTTKVVIDPKDPRLAAPPADLSGAVADVVYAVQLQKLGAWAAILLILVQLIVFVVKRLSGEFPVMKKYGTLITIALSALASVLSSVVGGMAWPAAGLLFLTTAAPKFVVDVLNEWAHENAPAAPAVPFDPTVDPDEPKAAPVAAAAPVSPVKHLAD